MGIITKDVTPGTEREKAQKRNKEGAENNRKTRKVSEIRSSVRPDSIRTDRAADHIGSVKRLANSVFTAFSNTVHYRAAL